MIDFIKKNNLELLTMEITENKLILTFKNKVQDEYINKLHELIFLN